MQWPGTKRLDCQNIIQQGLRVIAKYSHCRRWPFAEAVAGQVK
jgi:hypothetical protein